MGTVNESRKEVGKPLPAPNKTQPGDLLAIPLGNGYFGYARVLRGTFLEILDKVSSGICDAHSLSVTPTKFYIEFYEPYDISPWIYLGKREFVNKDSAWGPPVWFGSSKKYILEKGSQRTATDNEAQNIMKQQLVHPDGIVDTIIDAFNLEIPLNKRFRLKAN